MPRLTGLIGSVLLVAASVLLGINATEPVPHPAKGLYQQGALRLLMRAEAALRERDFERALGLFRSVGLRAHRIGADGIFGAIRCRVGSVGQSLLAGRQQPRERPFLTNYVAWSADFGLSSAAVEAIEFGFGAQRKEFDYVLVDQGGRQTIWGTEQRKNYLPPFRMLAPSYLLAGGPSLFYNHRVSELPSRPKWAFGYRLPIRMGEGGVPTSVRIEGLQPETYDWYVSIGNLVQWQLHPQVVAPGVTELRIPTAKDVLLDRLIIVGDSRPAQFKVALVHSYQPLSLTTQP